MTEVYIVGIDMLKFGRYPDRTPAQLAAEATLGALEDAGLGIKDIQGVYAASVFDAGHMIGQQVLREIGMTGAPCTNVSNACASGANALRDAYRAIRAGVHDIVLAVGTEKMPKGMHALAFEGPPPEGLFGSGSMPAVFAEAGSAHAAKYGTTFAQFAQVSVKNHHHSTMNPKSMYRIETPLEQVMAAEMISWPNTKLMCSVNVDGAAAAILMSGEKARQLGLMDRAVRVRGSAMASETNSEMSEIGYDFNGATRAAAKTAYEMAGMGPEDISLVELHDCFATAEILHYENLGLCADGEAGRLIDTGYTALGGKCPVNVSGGLLSKGHPVGATGIANVYEIATHLRGKAGERQVEGARVGMTHVVGVGYGAACGIHILEKV
ncbi:MAG: thiolase [Caulobacteraceae bacterium]|nr:thiolase [Caulobacteraceae bacterium]